MAKKKYGPAQKYEAKLDKVMDRLCIAGKDYSFDWGRWSAWIQFTHKGKAWTFEHSVERSRQLNAENAKVKALALGSDCFAKLVLALEDLARMAEDGIFDLAEMQLRGLKALPPAVELPTCFRLLGFTQVPTGPEEVRQAYREKAKVFHSDAGGNDEDFKALVATRDQALKFFGEEKQQ